MRRVWLVLASAVMSVLLAVAVNVATGGSLPGVLAPLKPLAWPAVLLSGLVTAVLAFWQEPARPPLPPASSPLASSPPVSPSGGEPGRPAELPARAATFTGRSAQARTILDAVEAGAEVVAISGPAGVGKSALVLEAAHTLRDRYPDGALFVRLRGASSAPAVAADVLARFLFTLGGTEVRPVGDVDALAAFFRTVVADRRLLIVLDDAADAAQVRPLLPGTGGSLVLVSSRPVLAELSGATLVPLGVFSADEARALLARLAGADRVAADPAATTAVLRACGNLPLAVGIAGSRLRARPTWTMATLAERLADEGRRLDELQVGRDAVRTSVAASYLELDASHQRIFRRLGAHPGTDFDAPAAAALADLTPSGARPALEQLVDRQLVEVVSADRYRLHDLLRLFASEQLDAAESAAALSRLAAYYLSAVDDERDNVVATVLAAVAAGLYEQAWELATVAERAFSRYPFHADGRRLWEAGLVAARELGQPDRIARAEYALARAAQYHGDVRLGLAHARESLVWWQRAGEQESTAAAHRRLASALHNAGRLAEAEDHYSRALDLAAAPSLRASTLRGLGSLLLAKLEVDSAVRTLQQAVEAQRAAGSEGGLARARTTLSSAHRKAGRTEVARELVEPQLAIFRRLGDAMWEVTALRELGRLDLAEGHLDAAAVRLEAARELAVRSQNLTGAGITLLALAEVDLAAGRLEPAGERYSQAIDQFRAVDDHVREGIALLRLAVLRTHQGRSVEASSLAARAGELLADVDLPDVPLLRARLDSPSPRVAGP